MKPLIIAVLMISFFLTSCQVDISHSFEDSVCSLPCWENIEPGISSGEEAKRILAEDLELHNVEISDISWGSSGYTIRADFDYTQGIELFIKDDLVEAVWINSTTINNLDFNISEVIRIYGEPEFVYIDEYSFGDQIGYMINILFPLQSMLIRMTDNGRKGYLDILENENISDVILMKDNEFMDFMVTYVDDYEYFNYGKVIPWNSYGKYCLSLESSKHCIE